MSKSRRKKISLAMALVLLSVGAFAAAGMYVERKFPRRHPPTKRQPNILIISTCSLRWQNLPPYGYARNTSPNLNELAEKSFVFKKSFTNRSWTNIVGFLMGILTNEQFEKTSYAQIGQPFGARLKTWGKFDEEHMPEFYIQAPDRAHKGIFSVSEFLTQLENTKKAVLESKGQRFMLELHSKIIHFPYKMIHGSDNYRLGDRQYFPPNPTFMNEENRKRLQGYVHDTKKHLDRIPGMLLMDGTPAMYHAISQHPRVALALERQQFNPSGEWVSWVLDPVFQRQWKKLPDQKKDLELITNLYDTRLYFQDWALRDLMNLYGDKELQDNTIIIYTGDHGEPHGEHGLYLHGEEMYDEEFQVPTIVHFPGQERKVEIDEQIFQGTLAKMVTRIMTGEVTEENFLESAVKDPLNRAIVSKNCADSQRSVRFENRWRLVVNRLNDEANLYDLERDPGEKINVAAAHPDIVSKLQEAMLDGESGEAADVTNEMVKDCVR